MNLKNLQMIFMALANIIMKEEEDATKRGKLLKKIWDVYYTVVEWKEEKEVCLKR